MCCCAPFSLPGVTLPALTWPSLPKMWCWRQSTCSFLLGWKFPPVGQVAGLGGPSLASFHSCVCSLALHQVCNSVESTPPVCLLMERILLFLLPALPQFCLKVLGLSLI